MSYKVIIFAKAQSEYQEAAEWYEDKKIGLGSRFIDVLESKLKSIAVNPESYVVRKKHFREAPLYIFPYNIVYQIYEESKLVAVSAVFHTSRNPQRKYRK